jgi:hypothetical protein
LRNSDNNISNSLSHTERRRSVERGKSYERKGISDNSPIKREILSANTPSQRMNY